MVGAAVVVLHIVHPAELAAVCMLGEGVSLFQAPVHPCRSRKQVLLCPRSRQSRAMAHTTEKVQTADRLLWPMTQNSLLPWPCPCYLCVCLCSGLCREAGR